jgi:pyruvate kinase
MTALQKKGPAQCDVLMPISLDQISRTKTIVTVGPACASLEKISDLIRRGAAIFRLNMAHGSRAEHQQAMDNIRDASEQLGVATGILVDLAGPKIRLGQLATEPLQLATGTKVKFVPGTQSIRTDELTCLYEPLIGEINAGDTVVLADGLVRLRVLEKRNGQVVCQVVDGGEIRSRQGVNLPGTALSIPAFGEIDQANAIWAAEQAVDFVSLSFIRHAGEIKQLKKILDQFDPAPFAIAKIEKRQALDHLEEIVQASDGIMVARGDLGVEIDIEKTPLAQKRIIRTCLQHCKPVIVATQMLESMHRSKQPTRAEVSDVANAILDGADACMLSGETAIGDYPSEAVTMMQKIMIETEQMLKSRSSRNTSHDECSWSIPDAVIFGSAQIARRINAKMVVIASSTCESALIKSKQRDYIHTVCLTDNPATLRRMCLFWGVVPVFLPNLSRHKDLTAFISRWAKSTGNAAPDDPIVVVTDTELLPGAHDTVLVTKIQ